MAASQSGAHKNEYSQELPLLVNLSPQCDTVNPASTGDLPMLAVDLAQSLRRSILFPLDPGVHRTLCVPPNSGVSTSPSLWNSCYQTLLAFKARFSGGFSHCQTPKLGTWYGAQDFDSCRRTSVVQLFSSLWVTHLVGMDFIMIAPLLPSHCGFFVFGCRVPFLVGPTIFLPIVIQQLVVILTRGKVTFFYSAILGAIFI